MRTCRLLLLGIVTSASAPAQAPAPAKPFHPVIPRVWDDAILHDLELPRASGIAVHHIPAAFYYTIPERTIWKSYPVYAAGKEPAGYWQWLQQQDPAEAIDWKALKTKEDWIRAGSVVFESANDYDDPFTGFVPVRDPAFLKAVDAPPTKDGILPFFRYVIREKGKVQVTTDPCTECHVRVMPDGKAIRGAQGNFAFGRLFAYSLQNLPDTPGSAVTARSIDDHFYGIPWIKPDPTTPLADGSLHQFREQLASMPAGVNPRQGTSAMYPIQVPDLIGVKDRLYLDRTGLQQHRDTADLMRYDAVQNFILEVTNYDGFIPANHPGDSKLPDAKTLSRDSDRSLYALALYMESLKPPTNPNHFGKLAAHGQKVFTREGCPKCHTPPLYSNNMLTPVEGFKVSDEERKTYRVLPVVVGTDSYNALNTRRGTGFYKVPSLRGVWYRGPFEHNGSVATLEDWFDVHRLDDDYVPTGYKGFNVKTRAIPGHEYGLDLSPEDKKALIAFLKTL
jgi:hypothetical protein